MEEVIIRGKYFYKGDRRFLVNGVCYQFSNSELIKTVEPPPSSGPAEHVVGEGTEGESTPIKKKKKSVPQDVLAAENVDDLKRSLVLFRELELNCLNVYWIDPDKDHDEAMQLLAEAGIYVLVGVHDLTHAINRVNPLESYNNPDNLRHYFRVLDVMSRYTNTLGVFVANSVVIAAPSTEDGPAVIRAVCRDLKRYMKLRAEIAGGGDEIEVTGGKASPTGQRRRQRQRVLPLGYSAPDNASMRRPMFDYTVAGPVEEGLDFFAMNCYAWVGESSIKISGYENLEAQFADTPIPILFSSYGAKVYDERIFAETPALYDPYMTKTFSGGCVYQFFQMANNYGLVMRKLPSSLEGSGEGAEVEAAGASQDGHAAKKEGTTEIADEKVDGEETWIPLKDYENLKSRLVSCRELRNPVGEMETAGEEVLLPRPTMPQRQDPLWRAVTTIPESPLNWDQVKLEIKEQNGDGEGWVDVAGLVRGLERQHI